MTDKRPSFLVTFLLVGAQLGALVSFGPLLGGGALVLLVAATHTFPWTLAAALVLSWVTAAAVTRGVRPPPLPPPEPPIEHLREVGYRSVRVERIVPPPPRRSRAPAVAAWSGILLTPLVALVSVGLAAARGHFAVGFQAWLLAVPVTTAVPLAARRLLAGRLRATSVGIAIFALLGWAFLYAAFIVPRGDDRYVSDAFFASATTVTGMGAVVVAVLFGIQRLEGRLVT